VSAFCGCLSAGLLRKPFKLVDRSFDREPLVAAGMEFTLAADTDVCGSMDAVMYVLLRCTLA